MKTTILVSIFLFFLNACMPTQSSENKTKIDMSSEGFTYVETVTTKSPAPCDTLFKTESGEILELYNYHKVIKELDTAYWIKFRRLRRKANCPKAQPVEVTEIQKVVYK